jgi:RNA polymerase sigma-B factor
MTTAQLDRQLRSEPQRVATTPITAAASARADRRHQRIAQTDRLLDLANHRRGSARHELLGQVVELNAAVARSIAHRYRNRGESAEDLDQVAYLGLVKAVNAYDPEKGFPFLAYAVPTITGEVKRYFRDTAWTVRPPRRIQELQAEITPAVERLSQSLGRGPRAFEIAQHLGHEEGQIIEALACAGCFAPSSIDDRGPDDDWYQVADRLGQDERGFARVEAVAALSVACRALKPRDRRILYLRFYEEWTQERIASELGVTQMQVSRLLARITGDLRNALQGRPPSARKASRPAAATPLAG